MKRRRFASSVILTLVLLPLVGLLRPPSLITGVPSGKMWIGKCDWPAQYDIVLAGCSRAAMGLSPSTMAEALPNHRIVNFAFTSQVYSEDYLQAVERLFDPTSSKRAIVYSIQPVNFLMSFADKSGYRLYSSVHPAIRWLELNHSEVTSFTKPFVYSDITRVVTKSPEGYYQVYHPDGWISSQWIPENPSYWLPKYHEYYLRDKVSNALIDSFLSNVTELRAKGVAVFAVRLPTTSQMTKLEDRMSGLDPKEFRKRFEESGGVWIELPEKDYDCYDGSHLSTESAIDISRSIGKAIARVVR